ncbi:MAG: ABC transporter substrate-binding protein [Thiohalocapsa sp.]
MSATPSQARPASARGTARSTTPTSCARAPERTRGAAKGRGMKRLALLLLAAAWLVPPAAVSAQAADKTYRIGFVAPAGAASPEARRALQGLTRALAARGYSPGKDLIVVSRFDDGRPERLPALIKELLDSRVDVLVTRSYPAARDAKAATTTVPIVMSGGGDPVETGLAPSLSRPGGNLTGISDISAVLSAKRLELLKSAVPGLKRVAMLWNADDLGMTMRYKAAADAAAKLGIAVQPLGVREPDDFAAAFAAMEHDKPDGIMMVTDVLTLLNHKRVFEFAATHRIPAIYEVEGLVRDGGLMSYGPDGKEVTAGVADLVARILKGAKPADLPFEEPTRFRFVINKKTADALGLTLPPAVLERADEVIE